MCLAVPAKAVEVRKNGLVLVERPGLRKEIFNAVEGLKKGDFVLVQQGFAVEKVSEKAARESWSVLDEKEN